MLGARPQEGRQEECQATPEGCPLEVESQRLRQVRAQGKRMAKGVHKVYKQGINLGAIYGVKCLGMSNRQLEQLRKAAGRAYSTAMQRSLTLQLALCGQGPAHEVTAAPIAAWASAQWEKRVPRAWLKMARGNQAPGPRSKLSWAKVRGQQEPPSRRA